MILIINEWLWHDLIGENGERRQQEALLFLKCILKICDKVAVMEETAFAEKFWKLLNAIPREAVRIFKNRILFNSAKCELIDYTDKYTLNGVKPDDFYLYNLCCILGKKYDICVVTTDKPLIEVLKKHGFKVKHRDKFVEYYVKECTHIDLEKSE